MDDDASLLRKVVGPTLPAVLLHRKHLVIQLQGAVAPEAQSGGAPVRYKLILCCAPAGYGKTTLLADFARSLALPCCWYFLDQGDTDPVVFLRALLASLRQSFPQFGTELDLVFRTLVPAGSLPPMSVYHAALDALCAALAVEITGHVLLIFSNYEEINESETLTVLVNYLLKKLPPRVTLVIESRVMPNLSFTSFVIHDAMGGLDRDALRFSAQEIMELARLQGLSPLTDADAEHLATSFEGWIAGILLGTRVGDARLRQLPRGFPQSKLPSPIQAAHHRNMLFTYVVETVLKQDSTTSAFLQAVSLLQQIDPAICNGLCEIGDAVERLTRLERQGLFLTSYESAAGVIYTCHPVIRNLLSQQLRNREPERFLVLHRRAATLWHASHNHEQAMYHALASNAFDLAVSLILDESERLLQEGQRETINRWLAALPAEVRENHPRLLLLQATLDLERGQHASALLLLDQAEALVSASDEAETRVFGAMIAIARSKALFQMGEYLQAQTLCQQVLREVPEHERALRAAAEMRLGICANLQGQFSAGITHLQQALHIWANQPPLKQAMEIQSALANTYYLIGNFSLARHHLTHLLEICEHLQDTSGKESALILQGLIAQDQGLMSEAEAAFRLALTLARTVPHAQRGEAYALVNLGVLLVEQGRYAQALQYAEQGLVLARQWGNRTLSNDALVCIALSYLFLGDPVSALLTVEKMETSAPSEGTAGYERVWRDLTYGLIFLSQHQYEESAVHLAEIEAALPTTDFKRGSFQAKLRLAACRVAQEQPEEAVCLLQEVTSLLDAHRAYTHLVQVELQWLPDLLAFLQKHPQLASLRSLSGISEPLMATRQQNPAPVHLPLEESTLPKLTIYAFGEPTVLMNGQPIKRWRLASVMELFFFLLDAAQPVSKESILTALWPEYDEQTTQTFHSTVHYLRKLLGETCMVFSPAGYHLDLASAYGEQVFYDVQAFQQYRAEAEQALAQGEDTQAREALLKMVQIYRGDYGRAFYSDWCTFRRDELRTAYLEARRQLAQIAWDAEAWSESAEHWRQMLRLDACLEEAHYGLIRCYLRQGKRGAALRQYQTCQKVLNEELGVQPGQALQHLYQRLTAKPHVE